MASIERRVTAKGERRYDVRWHVSNTQRRQTFGRRQDAEAFKRKVEGAELAGLVVDLRAGEERFGDFAERWLDTRLVKGRHLSPATLQGYRGLLARNIMPTFKATQLRKITPEMVRTWHADITKRPGQDAAAKSYRLLRAILATAVTDERIARNPCQVKGAGIEQAPERELIDTATVLDLADAIDPRLRALVLLAAFGGLRTGEMLGLRRMDVDLLHAQVHVRQQAQRVTGQGRTVGRPKSDAGRRVVAIPGIVVEALEAHLASYAQPGAEGIVFTGRKGGPLHGPKLSAAWRSACQKVGVEGLHVHDLRHHAATIMARMPGVTTRELMARIGHSSPRAALIYQHATEERDRAIAAFLDAHIAEVQRPAKAPAAPFHAKTADSG